MTHALRFTEKDLRRLAGARSFERGLGYLSAVSRLEIGDEAITATVDGNDTKRKLMAVLDQHGL
ncbi:hypothetical protein OG239_35665 [Streptomyces sp. NBC_00868]|uniref:hypothetical protein n=1 Tax=unclassified Streptomyces TaxID=2593676 RepID=UPI00325524AA|nr:hypothetical protein OG239_35665 [Streptomyces sp. NBC_00868]